MDALRGRRLLPSLLAPLALVAGCAAPGGPPGSMELELELSDRTFCPSGRLIEGPARSEQIRATVRARARQGTFRSPPEAMLRIVLFPEGEPLQVLQREEVPVPGEIGGDWIPLAIKAPLVPPPRQGSFVVRASLADGSMVEDRIGVWFDERACPEPGKAADPTSATTSDSSSATPPVSRPASGFADQVRIGIEPSWECDAEGGVHDLRIRARVENHRTPGRAVLLGALEAEGIPELDAFSLVEGRLVSGYLQVGTTAVFEAHGWTEVGDNRIEVRLSRYPDVVAIGEFEIDCGPPGFAPDEE